MNKIVAFLNKYIILIAVLGGVFFAPHAMAGSHTLDGTHSRSEIQGPVTKLAAKVMELQTAPVTMGATQITVL